MQRQALVVDDSRVARLTLSRLLAPYDLDIVEIASGEEVLSYLQANSDYPDIIFIDVTMKGLDGFETTKRIKQNEVLSNIPIVMCTSHDTESDQNHALDVGAVAALTKPPQENTLAQIMDQLKPQAEPKQQIQAQVEPISKPLTITPEVNIDALISNQAQPAPQKKSDNGELESEITANIERKILPKIQQTMTERVEDIGRQIVLESVEIEVASHVASVLPALKEQIKAHIKQNAVEVAQQAAQQIIDQSAETAVQYAVEDLKLEEKAAIALQQQGEKWLNAQQQPLSLMASQQLEKNLVVLITQYLDLNLEEKVAPYLTKQQNDDQAAKVQQKQAGLDSDFAELSILVTALNQKVSLLKEVVIVLTVVVAGAVISGLFLNAGIL